MKFINLILIVCWVAGFLFAVAQLFVPAYSLMVVPATVAAMRAVGDLEIFKKEKDESDE